MRETAKKIALLMGQLANENRLMILCALLQKPMTVGEIKVYVPDISAPALSQHLHKLRDAGLIASEKKAPYTEYRISDPHLEKLINLLKAEYCSSEEIF